MTDPIHIAGVILAGGKSIRMGTPKHALKIEGVPLLEKQAKLLADVGIKALSVSVADAGQVECQYPLLVDRYPEAGPLGAIATALEAHSEAPAANAITHICVIAVDLPALEVGLLRNLLEGCTKETGVIPALSADGKLEPLCAVYPAASRSDAIQQIKMERYAVRDFAETLIAKETMRRYLLTGSEIQQLRNANSPQDL